MTAPVQDPFKDPIIPPSTYPNQSSLRGRLLFITPRKIETKPSNLNPGQTQEIITADVTVVDGLGPVPQMNNGAHTGQWIEGPDFTGIWFSGQRVADQLRPFVGTGQSVLSVMETHQPGQPPRKGNPWGLVAATDEQKNQARQFLASRTVGAAAAPTPAPATQPAPAPMVQQAPAPMVQQAPAPMVQQAPAPMVQQAPAPAPQAAPMVQQAPAAQPVPGANPFLTQQPAPAPAAAAVNPFLQSAQQ